MGGQYGVEWTVLILARAFWSNSAARKGSHPEYAVSRLTHKELQSVSESCKLLIENMAMSVHRLRCLCAETDQPESQMPLLTKFKPASYWSHRVGDIFSVL